MLQYPCQLLLSWEVSVMQQVIPQHLCNMHHWASSSRCSHHGTKFSNVTERDEGEVNA